MARSVAERNRIVEQHFGMAVAGAKWWVRRNPERLDRHWQDILSDATLCLIQIADAWNESTYPDFRLWFIVSFRHRMADIRRDRCGKGGRLEHSRRMEDAVPVRESDAVDWSETSRWEFWEDVRSILPEQESRLLELRFREGRRLLESAQAVGRSEAWACQSVPAFCRKLAERWS